MPEYFEINITHLPVNNIGKNIKSLTFYGSKNTSSAYMKMTSKRKLRPSTEISICFSDRESISFSEIFKQVQNLSSRFFRVYTWYSVMDPCSLSSVIIQNK